MDKGTTSRRVFGIITLPLWIIALTTATMPSFFIAWKRWFWDGELGAAADIDIINSMRGSLISSDPKLRLKCTQTKKH